jgi:hypothetical protein
MDNVTYIHPDVLTDRFQRVELGRRGPRKEVEVLIPGLLLKGQTHLFYGASDTGKSWISHYVSRECMKEGIPVIYFDLENLADVMEERMLDSLEVSQADIDDYFDYYPAIDLALDNDSKAWFTNLLDSFAEPGLIVWDSLLGFLSLAGLKEDDSGDFESWARTYLDQPRYRGWTSQVLDHTGHDGRHPRGSSRKSQSVQVVWKVEKKRKFNRTTEGRQQLTLEKDCLSYLPGTVEVTIGNTPFTFKTKYDGQEFLNNNTNDALKIISRFEFGASHGVWKEACTGMAERTFDRARKYLVDNGHVLHNDRIYRITDKGKKEVL